MPAPASDATWLMWKNKRPLQPSAWYSSKCALSTRINPNPLLSSTDATTPISSAVEARTTTSGRWARWPEWLLPRGPRWNDAAAAAAAASGVAPRAEPELLDLRDAVLLLRLLLGVSSRVARRTVGVGVAVATFGPPAVDTGPIPRTGVIKLLLLEGVDVTGLVNFTGVRLAA